MAGAVSGVTPISTTPRSRRRLPTKACFGPCLACRLGGAIGRLLWCRGPGDTSVRADADGVGRSRLRLLFQGLFWPLVFSDGPAEAGGERVNLIAHPVEH